MSAPQLDHLIKLLEELRRALERGKPAVEQVVEASTARLRGDPDYAAGLRSDVHDLLRAGTSTHLLTEFGILSDESLLAGVMRRVGASLAPAPALSSGLESLLSEIVGPGDSELFAVLEPRLFEEWAEAMLEEEGSDEWDDRSHLASAIVILATRVSGVGVEARLSERMPTLEAWNSPFIELSRRLDRFAEAYVQGEDHQVLADGARSVIHSCRAQVLRFRAEKAQLGTTLHLSSASLRMLQQLDRLELLVDCTLRELQAHAVTALGLAISEEMCRARPVRHFIGQKLDLLAYLLIGQAAQKGDKYAVRSGPEYWGFWRKSLLGGLLVAVFACIKLDLSHDAIAPVPQAFIYGLNYAICFALIYLLGATLATKQPALTASRIADALEEAPEHESFPELVRAIWRSQFVSFLGNILAAATFAVLLALGFQALTGQPLISHDEALTLAKKIHPLKSGSLWFAAIAGVLLSSAGFLAAFVDNAVVFHRVADRVRAGGGVFGWVPVRLREWLAGSIEKKAGALSGNVALGFLLGSAGAVGLMLGIPFDIRHIAFASSHGGLAVFYAPELQTPVQLLIVAVSVSAIGLVNFIVSFALTLVVAINARRLDGIDWRSGVRGVLRLIRANPVGFILPIRDRAETGE